MAEQLDKKVLRAATALIALEKAGFYLARTDQVISARVADDVDASLLKVPVGSPLIFMSAFFSAKEDEPLVIEEGDDRTVTVFVDPAVWFVNDDGSVDDLTAFDYDATGEVVKFEAKFKDGFTKIELDDD